jgi:SAM-dependent methyltransferase
MVVLRLQVKVGGRYAREVAGIALNCGRDMNMWTAPESYEGYIGRWSRATAPEFLAWLHVRRGERWLDIGCGTGETTRAILELTFPDSVDGFDLSQAFINYARESTRDERATFLVGDAQALPYPDHAFDVAMAGLCLNAMPDQAGALAEMMRVVKPGGVVGVYVWDFDGKMQMLRHFWDSVEALDPGTEESNLNANFHYDVCKPGPLTELFRSVGLHDVEVRAVDTPTVFKDFDDYWTPFLNGEAPAQKYTAALSADRRAELRERLKTTLPVTGNGSIPLIARSWAAKGRVPR